MKTNNENEYNVHILVIIKPKVEPKPDWIQDDWTDPNLITNS